MRKILFTAVLVTGLTSCTPMQVQHAQADQAIIQAVLDAACQNNALEAAVSTAVPQVTLGCVGGVAGAAIVTAVMNDPALVARVEALHR